MTGVDDLVTWLRAQLDDDEQAARAATGGAWEVGPTFGGHDNRVYVKPEGPGIDTIGTCVIAGQVANTPEYRANAEHIARNDPARVLAEVDAKRRIIELADDATCLDMSVDLDRRVGTRDEATEPYLGDQLLRQLAMSYAARPGYQESWRP